MSLFRHFFCPLLICLSSYGLLAADLAQQNRELRFNLDHLPTRMMDYFQYGLKANKRQVHTLVTHIDRSMAAIVRDSGNELSGPALAQSEWLVLKDDLNAWLDNSAAAPASLQDLKQRVDSIKHWLRSTDAITGTTLALPSSAQTTAPALPATPPVATTTDTQPRVPSPTTATETQAAAPVNDAPANAPLAAVVNPANAPSAPPAAPAKSAKLPLPLLLGGAVLIFFLLISLIISLSLKRRKQPDQTATEPRTEPEHKTATTPPPADTTNNAEATVQQPTDTIQPHTPKPRSDAANVVLMKRPEPSHTPTHTDDEAEMDSLLNGIDDDDKKGNSKAPVIPMKSTATPTRTKPENREKKRQELLERLKHLEDD